MMERGADLRAIPPGIDPPKDLYAVIGSRTAGAVKYELDKKSRRAVRKDLEKGKTIVRLLEAPDAEELVLEAIERAKDEPRRS